VSTFDAENGQIRGELNSYEHFSIMAAGHCRFSLWSGCVSNHNEAGTSISIMLIESPEFIHGEDVKSTVFPTTGTQKKS